MKKVFFAFVAGCIPALATMNGTFAQNSMSPGFLDDSKPGIVFNRTLVPSNSEVADIAVENAKAKKNFSRTYKGVAGETWLTTKQGVQARFSVDGVTTFVYYGKNGQWLANLKGYGEDKLPFEVRDMVKRVYYDFNIIHVKEIETMSNKGIPTYIVYLEDDTHYKLIRVGNGEMDVWKEFTKQ